MAIPVVSKDELFSRLGDADNAMDYVDEKTAKYAGFSWESEEMKWISKPSVSTVPWLQDYEEDLKHPEITSAAKGWIRELGRVGCLKSYQSAKHFELMEDDALKYYYNDYFYQKPHVNFISYYHDDDPLQNSIGPIIVSIENRNAHTKTDYPQTKSKKNFRRVLIQSKMGTERLSLPMKTKSSYLVKKLKNRAPEFEEIKFLPLPGEPFEEALLDYEKKILSDKYKIGILYAKAGQKDENTMYSNEHGSEEFNEFIEFLGSKVKLKGWDKYRGGLEVNHNTTGTHSIYENFGDCEIMFHVSTFLPFSADDPQQVERKRHLGNDVVVIIFKDQFDPNEKFDPSVFKSQFNHVFVVVTPMKQKGKRFYKVAVTAKDGVERFGPDLFFPPIFAKTKKFKRWFLSKIINGQRAALHAPDFIVKMRNTRRIQLAGIIKEHKHNATNYGSVIKTGSRIISRARSSSIDFFAELQNHEKETTSIAQYSSSSTSIPTKPSTTSRLEFKSLFAEHKSTTSSTSTNFLQSLSESGKSPKSRNGTLRRGSKIFQRVLHIGTADEEIDSSLSEFSHAGTGSAPPSPPAKTKDHGNRLEAKLISSKTFDYSYESNLSKTISHTSSNSSTHYLERQRAFTISHERKTVFTVVTPRHQPNGSSLSATGGSCIVSRTSGLPHPNRPAPGVPEKDLAMPSRRAPSLPKVNCVATVSRQRNIQNT